MKTTVISGIIMVMFVFHGIVPAQEAAPVENPLKTEMRLLDSAFKNLIDSLIFNNPKTIQEFHKNMKGLIESSGNGNMKKVQDITHRLLNGCVQCHNRFRN